MPFPIPDQAGPAAQSPTPMESYLDIEGACYAKQGGWPGLPNVWQQLQ